MSEKIKVLDIRKDKTSAFMNAHITFYYKITKDIGFGHEGRKMEQEGIIRADDVKSVSKFLQSVVEEYSEVFKQK